MQRMVDVELKKQLKEELRKMARNIIAPGVRQQCKEGC